MRQSGLRMKFKTLWLMVIRRGIPEKCEFLNLNNICQVQEAVNSSNVIKNV